MPGASCLTQALVLRFLLARTGETCSIRIGVTQEPGAAFEAHAWVLHGNDVLIGGVTEKLERFTPLADL